MSVAICDLWPDDVAVTDVFSPLAIMKHQAGQLRARTRGLLEAEIKTTNGPKGEATHEFWIIAPALNRYRYLLFKVRHERDFVYPATVISHMFGDWDEDGSEDYPSASSQDRFQELLGQIFAHGQTRTVLQSLIARINDTEVPDDAATDH